MVVGGVPCCEPLADCGTWTDSLCVVMAETGSDCASSLMTEFVVVEESVVVHLLVERSPPIEGNGAYAETNSGVVVVTCSL